MTQGMDGLGSSTLRNLTGVDRSQVSAKHHIGGCKGTPVTQNKPTATVGLKQHHQVGGKAQTTAPSTLLGMRTVKNADSEFVASIKGKVAIARDVGRIALKTIKHGWGELKRFVLKENFKPIPDNAFDRVKPEKKAELESKKTEFEQQRGTLNKLKGEMVGLIDQMQAFEDKFSDSLALMGGNMEISKQKAEELLAKEEGEVKLPIPTGENFDKAEYVVIRASRPGNTEARQQEISNFIEAFSSNKGYQEYLKKDNRVADIKADRDDLKAELKSIRQEMVDIFKGDLNDRVEQLQADVKAEFDSVLPQAKTQLKQKLESLENELKAIPEGQDSSELDSKIQENQRLLDGVDTKHEKLLQDALWRVEVFRMRELSAFKTAVGASRLF